MRGVIVALIVVSLSGCYRSHRRGEPDERGFVTVGAGSDHTCAIDGDGGLWCWGFAQHGELGDGSGREELGCDVRITEGPIATTPREVLEPLRAVRVDGGGSFTCAILDEHAGASCWGAGCRGELGDGLAMTRFVPGPVSGAGRTSVIELGRAHACFAGDLGVACWGQNDHGQLGLGTTSPWTEPGATEPLLVEHTVDSAIFLGLGDAHSCAASETTVWCWGANGAGQLGDGTTELRSVPRPVVGLPPERIASLDAGERFTCASIEDGGVWCWGWNERYQLGHGHSCDAPIDECMRSPEPLEVPLPPGGTWTVVTGAQFACAYRDGSGVLCWGADEVGQLGDGTIGGFRSMPMSVVGAPSSPEEVTLGDNHGCALARGGIVCWGRNAQGQLGDGTTTDRASAAPITFP